MNPDFVDFVTALIAADARLAATRILAISKHWEKIPTRCNALAPHPPQTKRLGASGDDKIFVDIDAALIVVEALFIAVGARPPRISFSHAAAWKALISKYIVTIPLIGETRAPIPSIFAEPPHMTLVRIAIMAKVGEAAKASTSATLNAARFQRVAPPLDPPEQFSLIASRSRCSDVDMILQSPGLIEVEFAHGEAPAQFHSLLIARCRS